MPSFPVIFSFARSGGTLVNQLLGMHPDCMVLSEVNPAASVVPIERQALDWLKLIEQSEWGNFSNLTYAEQIALLEQRASSRNKKLIIRDWVSANFLPGMGDEMVMSSYVLEQLIYIAHAGYSSHPVVVTRRAMEVYHSVVRCFAQFRGMTPVMFLDSYMAYVNAVRAFPKVSLETLQSHPRETLANLLTMLDISTDFMDQQLSHFAQYQFCTGNNTLSIPSSSSRMKEITKIKPAEKVEYEQELLDRFVEADFRMGYVS